MLSAEHTFCGSSIFTDTTNATYNSMVRTLKNSVALHVEGKGGYENYSKTCTTGYQNVSFFSRPTPETRQKAIPDDNRFLWLALNVFQKISNSKPSGNNNKSSYTVIHIR